jgi:hypothetical protein
MKLELLFDSFGEIPAEKYQSLLAKAFGVQEPPVFVGCRIHNGTSWSVSL